jgi:hypothetical protein
VRSFNGSTQYGSVAAHPQANGTILTWLKPNFNTGDSVDRFLWEVYDGGTGGGLGCEHYSDNNWYIGWATGAGDNRLVVAAATLAMTSGNLYNLIYRWNDTTDAHAVFLNGVSKGTGSALNTVSISTNMIFGADSSGSAGFCNATFGTCAMWSVDLTDLQVAAIANGADPTMIRPDALLGAWLVMGAQSPEPDMLGVNAMTLTASPAAAQHHPLYMRRSPLIAHAPQPSGGGSLSNLIGVRSSLVSVSGGLIGSC